jgi:hypothetical protein
MDANDATLKDVIEYNPRLWEIAQQHARMIEVAILRNNRDKAMAIVDRAFQTVASEVSHIKLDAIPTPIGQVIYGKPLTLLSSAGIDTVEQLCGMTVDDLMEIPQVKEYRVRQISEQLRHFGLRLKPKRVSESPTI